MRALFLLAVLPFGLFLLPACGEATDTGDSSKAGTAKGSSELDAFLVSEAPKEAVAVKASKALEDGAEVVVRGRLSNFTESMAMFTLADEVLVPCNEGGCDCPTPWDYCCDDPEIVKEHMLTVELRDGKKPLSLGLKGEGAFDYLKTVTVSGRMEKDELGNVIIAAERVFIHPGS